VEDLAAAVERLGADGAMSSSANFEAEKRGKVLEKKFDELFRQAKENPDLPPPKRDFDFD
jgi:hypothetical protein